MPATPQRRREGPATCPGNGASWARLPSPSERRRFSLLSRWPCLALTIQTPGRDAPSRSSGVLAQPERSYPVLAVIVVVIVGCSAMNSRWWLRARPRIPAEPSPARTMHHRPPSSGGRRAQHTRIGDNVGYKLQEPTTSTALPLAGFLKVDVSTIARTTLAVRPNHRCTSFILGYSLLGVGYSSEREHPLVLNPPTFPLFASPCFRMLLASGELDEGVNP